MSILNSFDTSEEVLSPNRLVKNIENFPKKVMGVFMQQIIDELLASYETEIIDYLFAGYPIPIYKVKLGETNIAVYRSPIGAPATCGLMEEMAAKGGETFLYFGSCGTLDKNISAGHFIIPTEAYRDEGTSYHYVEASDYLKIPSANQLMHVFNEQKLPYITGKTWTTDAFYRETRTNMAARKAEGCLTVEMECAAIMAVASFRGLKAYQYLYAEDTLDGTKWDPRTLGNVANTVYKEYLDIGLKILTDL